MSDNNKSHASTPTKRFMRLAGMTASITGKVMSNSMKSLVGSAEQKAEARSDMYHEMVTNCHNPKLLHLRHRHPLNPNPSLLFISKLIGWHYPIGRVNN